MDYWKDWIRDRLDYDTSKEVAEASIRFCERLFTSAGLPISCSDAEASLPVIIKNGEIYKAMAKLRLYDNSKLNIVEMKIDSRAVDVTIKNYGNPPVLSHVWERVQE